MCLPIKLNEYVQEYLYVSGSQNIVISTVATLRAEHPRNLVSILVCLAFRAALSFSVSPAFSSW